MLKGFADLLTFSDANDVTVLVTTATRGGAGINLGGAPATRSDKIMAGVGLVVPFVSGSLVKKGIDAIRGGDNAKEALKIEIKTEDKISRELVNPPTNHGNAPTMKSDGSPVEIHHDGQNAKGPFKEMSKTDHRLGENYKANHPPGQTPLTKTERKEFNKAKTEYWKSEYPKE